MSEHEHQFEDRLEFGQRRVVRRVCTLEGCGVAEVDVGGAWVLVEDADRQSRVAVYEFLLPAVRSWANWRGHHFERHKLVKAWQQRAIVTEPRLRGSGRPALPWRRATYAARLFVVNMMDEDNSVAALKPALDLLKRQGFIIDDRLPCLRAEGMPTQTIDRSNPRLELTLRCAE